MSAAQPPVIWTPPPDVRSTSRIGGYLAWLAAERGLQFDDYADLWTWSTAEPGAFWLTIWEHAGILPPPAGPALAGAMPTATWFEGSVVNFARQALRVEHDGPAVRAMSDTRARAALTYDELRDHVARARAGLRSLGVGRGDRVAAYLPNVPEAVIGMLAAASLGAVWACCPPEFGVRAVLDRLGQIEPTVLLAVDGYRFGERSIDRTDELGQIRAGLPSLTSTVMVPYLREGATPPGDAAELSWSALLSVDADHTFDDVPFDHPLCVLFSSGTTGKPKAIVHGHGGLLLEHTKYLSLHHDLGVGDRFFWFSTTGWMMWNFLLSGLLVGAEIVLFDGDPAWPDPTRLWRLAAEERLTSFGVGAPYLVACHRARMVLSEIGDLALLRMVGSTGAPLPASTHAWVAAQLPGTAVASISGGTDVCTAFVGAVPLLPIRAGEITCRALGAKVEVYDEGGRPVVAQEGRLVVTAPMPSMPVAFWGDDGSRLRAAYFEDVPGIWSHGDWMTLHPSGSCTISGRSDATLNRGGVRLGTAELYEVVDLLPEVDDSLAVHLEDPDGGPGELLLFITIQPGAEPGQLAAEIRRRVRAELSPRHVPDEVVVVGAIPRTLSGKRLEVPVKRILLGADVDAVADRGSLVDQWSLDAFVDLRRRDT